jgi:hypothetical protein
LAGGKVYDKGDVVQSERPLIVGPRVVPELQERAQAGADNSSILYSHGLLNKSYGSIPPELSNLMPRHVRDVRGIVSKPLPAVPENSPYAGAVKAKDYDAGRDPYVISVVPEANTQLNEANKILAAYGGNDKVLSNLQARYRNPELLKLLTDIWVNESPTARAQLPRLIEQARTLKTDPSAWGLLGVDKAQQRSVLERQHILQQLGASPEAAKALIAHAAKNNLVQPNADLGDAVYQILQRAQSAKK